VVLFNLRILGHKITCNCIKQVIARQKNVTITRLHYNIPLFINITKCFFRNKHILVNSQFSHIIGQ